MTAEARASYGPTMSGRWRAMGAAALVAALVVVAGCSTGPPPPRLEELPPQLDEDPGSFAPIEQIRGRVVEQRLEHGSPEESDGDGLVTLESLVVTVAVTEREAEIEIVVPRGYVAYPPPETGETPVDLRDIEYIFTVRQLPDGRYECASPVCVVEAQP